MSPGRSFRVQGESAPNRGDDPPQAVLGVRREDWPASLQPRQAKHS